jgi:long-chain fatty acid transport protein
MNARIRLLLILLLTHGVSSAAETLSVVPDSAQALATAGGRFANLDDASAVRVSPANIAGMKEAQFLINAAVWNGDIRFDSSSGSSVKMSESWIFPGSLYAVVPIIPGKLAFGIGASTPFGMATKFPKDMDPALKYQLAYESRLLAIDITPALAFKVTENLSIAAGLDIIYSELTIRRAYPWALWSGPGTPDGELSLQGSGWGVGAYMGANWTIAKGHRIAVVGRLPVKVNYSGELEAKGMPAGAPALAAAGGTPTSSFKTDMTFPGSIAVGYGIDVTDRLTLGFDFQWSKNSSHDDIPINVDNNQALLAGNNAALLGWKSSIDLGTGITYALDEHWKLRCGYLFSENSQTAANYTPSVAVNDRHVFGVGVGWRGQRQSVDLAYAYVYNPTRTISGNATPVFDGRYKHQWHVLSLSLTHRF